MKTRHNKGISKAMVSLVLVLTFFASMVTQTYAATLPSWVYDAVFRVCVYGANQLANNTNLKSHKIIVHDSHAWEADLGSVRFNNKTDNTGSCSGYKTRIATTWSQSRTRTNVFMSGTKRSFTTGSNYLALQVQRPSGVTDNLERIQSGSSRLYEAYGNTKNLGTYDFRFIYTDSQTWDLMVTFNDRFFPDTPVDTQSILMDGENKNIPQRLYRLPSTEAGRNVELLSLDQRKSLTLQDLINERTDPATNSDVDIVRHFEVGSTVNFEDRIKSLKYIPERNVTEFKFESTSDEMHGLQFYGDLTRDYSVGSYMQLKFHVVEIGNVDGVVMESFDYLEDFNYDGDAAPHIEPYL